MNQPSESSPLPAGATPTRHLSRRDAFNTRLSFVIPTSKEEHACVKERHVTDENPNPWQCKLLKILNSSAVQHVIIFMLLLDVLILFTELAIDAFYPSCQFIERDAVSCCAPDEAGDVHRFMEGSFRLLAGGGTDGHHDDLCTYPLVETSNQAGCDDHRPGVHIAHEVLFSLTIIILVLFELELLLMVYLLGPKSYFSNFLYVLDLFIVTVSLVLEIVFRVVHEDILNDLVGILILFRVWRFVRIGHGLVASTFELQEERIHELKLYVQEVEEMLKSRGGELPKKKPSILKDSEHAHK